MNGNTARKQACTIWFTGLSGAGKTTVSRLVAEQLRARGRAVELLDGDVIRETISSGLGFSRADRDENIRRIGWVCELLTRNGIFACAAAISPYAEARRAVRARIGDFVLVYCQASLEALERRDKKGLYSRARAGLLRGLSGVDDPYEEPVAPEVVLHTDGDDTPEDSAAAVIAAVERLGYLDASARRSAARK